MNRSAPKADALAFIKTVGPILLALIGVATFNGVAAADIRERYQGVADILVYTAFVFLIIAMTAAIYPLIDPVFSGTYVRIKGAVANRHAKEEFRDWTRHWAECTSLLWDACAGEYAPKGDDWWKGAASRYFEVRKWLMAHEHQIPSGVLNSVLRTTDSFGGRSGIEFNLNAHGFFSLYRREELLMQGIRLKMDGDSRNVTHPQHSLAHIWDGLSRFSVAQGWGELKDWRDEYPTQSLSRLLH